MKRKKKNMLKEQNVELHKRLCPAGALRSGGATVIKEKTSSGDEEEMN